MGKERKCSEDCLGFMGKLVQTKEGGWYGFSRLESFQPSAPGQTRVENSAKTWLPTPQSA